MLFIIITLVLLIPLCEALKHILCIISDLGPYTSLNTYINNNFDKHHKQTYPQCLPWRSAGDPEDVKKYRNHNKT